MSHADRFCAALCMLAFIGLAVRCGDAVGNDATQTAHEVPYAVRPVMETPADASFRPEGCLKHYADAITKNWLTVMSQNNPEMLARFRDAAKEPYGDRLPWDGEYPGKHLTGAVEVYRLTRDPALKQSIGEFVAQLIALQRANGYLGVWAPQYELTGKGHKSVCGDATWDMWNHYHILMGLLYWYQESGDRQTLDAACRIGDLFCEKFQPNPGVWATLSDQQTNLSTAHALAILYRQTGRQKYLDLAQQVLSVETPKCGLDFAARAKAGEEYWQKTTGAGATRWETLHFMLAYSEMHLLTGNADYREAIEHYWWSLSRFDRHNNGGFSSLEAAYGNPYDTRSIEICCTIAYTALGVEALRLSGDSRIADLLEMSALNAGLAFFARNGVWSTYNTVMEGRIVCCDPNRPDHFGNPGIFCCTANAPRGIGMISHWALMRDSDGLAVNWYGPGTMSANVNGAPVTLNQSANYPRDDTVRIAVDPGNSRDFTLKFRIPFWGKQTSLKVNGQPVAVAPGTYASLRRTWQKGDVVEIAFDMRPRYWAGEREYAGRASVYRGPVLLAHRIAGPRENAELKGTWTNAVNFRETQYYSLVGSEARGDRAVFRFQGNWVSWRYNKFNGGGLARVFVDGKLVDTVDLYAENDMRDFFAYDRGLKGFFLSDRWESAGFGPGDHVLEIEVVGEKQEKSQGTWVYIREFHDDRSDPPFDAKSLAFRLLPSSDPNGLDIAVEATDAGGNPVVLQDYDAASKDERMFLTWFRVGNVPSDPDASNNPRFLGEEPRRYNCVVGTQTFCPHYQFTDQPKLIETAQAILDMGSNVLKFGVGRQLYYENDGDTLRNVKAAHPDVHNLKDLFEKEPSHKRVLEMPFVNYVIWVYPFGGKVQNHLTDPFATPMSADEEKSEYDEIHDLATHLFTTYSGSGKRFFLGHWEGDWLVLGKFDDQLALPQNKIDNMIAWLNVRQKAVDDARRETQHRNVEVWHYTEVNLVQRAMRGEKAVASDVLPHTQVDYVSYSSYDSVLIPGGEIRRDLRKALDYIESKLPPKPDIAGKRVFVGEYGFPEKRFGAIEQDAKSREVMRAGIEWGCPFVLYWEMYNNDFTGGEEQGLWLINNKGEKQPIYFTHERFYREMRQYIAEFRRQNGRVPAQAEFQQKAFDCLKN